jgi:hypothetical protein
LVIPLKKNVHNGGSFRFGQVGGVLQCLDKFELVHLIGAPDSLIVLGMDSGDLG